MTNKSKNRKTDLKNSRNRKTANPNAPLLNCKRMSVAGNETFKLCSPFGRNIWLRFFRAPSMTKDDWEYLVIILASLNFDQKKCAHHDSAVFSAFCGFSVLLWSFDLHQCIRIRFSCDRFKSWNSHIWNLRNTYFFSMMISNSQKE